MAANTVADQTELADFGILGPLEVSRSGCALPLGGPRQRAVLALLLLEANRVVSLDRLAEEVWSGRPPEGWVTTVQIYVSHLRQALEPGRARGAAGEVLVTRNRGYLLRVDGERLDAARFQDGFAAGRAALEAGRHAEAAETLRQALGLWRGQVLADLADYAFTRPEAARLEELRLAATEARVDADLGLGRHDALPAELEQFGHRASAAGAAARPAHPGAVPEWPAGRCAGRLPAGPRPAGRRARHRPRRAAAATARLGARPGPGAALAR
jgi:DNA-binding SARP family transcriptional activator